MYLQKIAEAGLGLSRTDLSLILFDTATEAGADGTPCSLTYAPASGSPIGKGAAWATRALVSSAPTSHLGQRCSRARRVRTSHRRGVAGTARALFEAGNAVRGTNFAQASERYLRAARLQFEAIHRGTPGAGRGGLWRYFANFLATRTGAAFSEGRYPAGRTPSYLGVLGPPPRGQELHSATMFKGLVNVMLSYYFATAAKQVGISRDATLGLHPPHVDGRALQQMILSPRWLLAGATSPSEARRTNTALIERADARLRPG